MLQIEKIMKAKNIGVTDLASRLNVNRQTVYYYIRQGDKNPASQLKKIAEALGVKLKDLFEDEEERNHFTCPHCGGVIYPCKNENKNEERT